MEILIEVLLELVLEIVTETLLALGVDIASKGKPTLEKRHPALIAVVYLCIGFFVGAMSVLIWRERVAVGPLGIGNLVASPVLVGSLMLAFGNWRRMNGKTTTSLANFWGGASFALGIALARLLLTS